MNLPNRHRPAEAAAERQRVHRYTTACASCGTTGRALHWHTLTGRALCVSCIAEFGNAAGDRAIRMDTPDMTVVP